MGRDGAAGERRNGRRRHLGVRRRFAMRDAGEVEPVSQRGDRGGGRGLRQTCLERLRSRRFPAPAARFTRPAIRGRRRPPMQQPTARSTGNRTTRATRPAQDPRRRRLSRRARRRLPECHATSTTPIAKERLRGVPGEVVARATARSAARRATARCGSRHLKRDRRSRTIQAAGDAGARRAGPWPARVAVPERRRHDVVADIRYAEAGRMSASSASSPSTTAPWAPSSAKRCAAPMRMRARDRPA